MTADLRSELEAELEKPPPEWWQPQKHDLDAENDYPVQLVGKVIGAEEAEFSSKEGGRRHVRGVVIETAEGVQWVVWGFHAHLAKQLRQLRPQIGQLFGVRFLGKPEGASGFRYKASVAGEKLADAEGIDWGPEPTIEVGPLPGGGEIDASERPNFSDDETPSW
jgi:hypothetical protein